MKTFIVCLLFLFTSQLVLPNVVLADVCSPTPSKTFIPTQIQTDATSLCKNLQSENYSTKTSYDGKKLTVTVTPNQQNIPSVPTNMGGFGIIPQTVTFTSGGIKLPAINLPNLPTFSVGQIFNKSSYSFDIDDSKLPTEVSQALKKGQGTVAMDVYTKPTYSGIDLVDNKGIVNPSWSAIDNFFQLNKIQSDSFDTVALQTKETLVKDLKPQFNVQDIINVLPAPAFATMIPAPAATPCTGPNCSTGGGDPCTVDPKNPGIKTAIGCIHTNPAEFVKDFLKFAVAIAGGLAFLMMLLGAFGMLTSGGNPESLNAGRERLTSAIIGLLFVIFAVLLMQIIGISILNIPGFKTSP